MTAQTDAQQIEAVLRQNEAALNAGDTAKIVPLYTGDGIFMPQNVPAQIGIEAVEAAYVNVFQMLKLNLAFTIHEIVPFGEYAYARTTSHDTQTLWAQNLQTNEYNNELFVFRRDGDNWKIARYLFAAANSPL